MNWEQTLPALLGFLGGILTALIAAAVARPKVRAEAKQANAHADMDITAAYNQILTVRTAEIAELRAELAQQKRRAALVIPLTKNIENLETALRKANQTIAALRGQVVTPRETPSSGREVSQ